MRYIYYHYFIRKHKHNLSQCREHAFYLGQYRERAFLQLLHIMIIYYLIIKCIHMSGNLPYI